MEKRNSVLAYAVRYMYVTIFLIVANNDYMQVCFVFFIHTKRNKVNKICEKLQNSSQISEVIWTKSDVWNPDLNSRTKNVEIEESSKNRREKKIGIK